MSACFSACVSVNIMVSCVGQSVDTIPIIPHFTILLNGLCTFPHVCFTTHPTTCFLRRVAHVLCWLGWHMTSRFEDVDVALAAQKAITNQSPRWWNFCLVSKG